MSAELGAIHITYYLDDEGNAASGLSVEGDLETVITIGLLEMAKDAVFSAHYAEEDEND